MLVRLTRARRLKAGRLLALVYALCMLAPTLSFALPGSQALSPCLADTSHVPGMMHLHADVAATHLHGDGDVHDHGMHVQASAAAHQAAAVPDSTRSKASHASGACCGLICLTALPAPLIEIAMPSVPKSSQEVDRYTEVADRGPSRLYRPPIA
jgi:hypothetical protein